MAFENPSFLEEGPTPGVPRAWSVASLVQGHRLVGFGTTPPYERAETFERWAQLQVRLGVIEQAFFDARPEGFEDFADGWDVDFYAFEFSLVGAESAAFGGEVVDRFALGWAVEMFAWEFGDGALFGASFSGAAAEGFESGHRNDNYRFGHGPGGLVRASLSGAQVETFETTWPAHDTRGGGHHGE